MSSSENKTNNTTNSSPKSSHTKEEVNKVLKMGTQYIASGLAEMVDGCVLYQLDGKIKRGDVEPRLASSMGFLTNKDGTEIDWKARNFDAPYDSSKLTFTSKRGDNKLGFSWKTMLTGVN